MGFPVKNGTYGIFDKRFTIKLSLKDIKELESVEDIIKLAGGKIQ